MSFEREVSWLDYECEQIQRSIMEPHRKYSNQGRHSIRVKRHNGSQNKDLSCDSGDELQDAGNNLGSTLITDHKLK